MDHPLTPQSDWHHLPRLAPEYYQGLAVVFWTITLERGATGWLEDIFHLHFRELLLHASAREGLYCPAYVLMPDHLHLVWMGMCLDTDQLRAMRFLRKYLQREFKRRSRLGIEFELQKQSHDEVLKEKDRTRGSLARTCFYVLDNPHRKGFVAHPQEWPYLGAILPGYPFMHPLTDTFWPQFWELYHKHRESSPPS
jgi:putative transposase